MLGDLGRPAHKLTREFAAGRDLVQRFDPAEDAKCLVRRSSCGHRGAMNTRTKATRARRPPKLSAAMFMGSRGVGAPRQGVIHGDLLFENQGHVFAGQPERASKAIAHPNARCLVSPFFNGDDLNAANAREIGQPLLGHAARRPKRANDVANAKVGQAARLPQGRASAQSLCHDLKDADNSGRVAR